MALPSNFRLSVEHAGCNNSALRLGFIKNGGPGLITELLQRADVARGVWEFRIIGGCRASGRTPRATVRRVENHGINMRLKPGDNGSCLEGVLVVGRDKFPLTPAELAKRIQNYLAKENTPEPETNETPLELDPEVVALLLHAVETVNNEGQWLANRQAFCEAVASEMGPSEVPEYWQDALDTLVTNGLLAATNTVYKLTERGKEALSDPSILKPVGVIEALDVVQFTPSATAAPALTPAPAVNGKHAEPIVPPTQLATDAGTVVARVVPLASADAADPVARILERAEALKNALSVMSKVQENRKQQAEVEKQRAELDRKLTELRAEEQKLTAGVNLSALATAVEALGA